MTMTAFFNRSALALLAVALLSACADDPATDDGRALVGAPDGALVASVNGEPITEPVLDVYARGRGLDPADPAQRQQAVDSLIENVLLAQHAFELGLTEQPDVQAELSLVRMQQLSGRTVATLRTALEVSEQQIAEYYRIEAERAGDTEWRTQHILFAEAAPAEAAVAQALEPGTQFDDLMTRLGGSARQARELDWANASQLPQELVEALRQLEDGQVAPVPIQTAFGWHVLRRLESRPFQPPPLDAVREGARRQLADRAMAEQVAALKAKAAIVGEGSPSAGSP